MALLQELASRLAIPGLPEWTGLLALLVLLLVGLAYLLMPFSVFGLKGRLDSIEAQLDELQGELRLITMRLAEAPRRTSVSEDWMDLPPVQPELRRQPTWPEASRRGRAEPRIE